MININYFDLGLAANPDMIVKIYNLFNNTPNINLNIYGFEATKEFYD